MHCENNLNFVCLSDIDVDRDWMLEFTMVRQVWKKSLANEVAPTGWQSSLKLVVSSTGVVGLSLWVGWGLVENVAIVEEMAWLRMGLIPWGRGRGDVPLNDVRIHVFDGLMK
jgi:hypothetical protein